MNEKIKKAYSEGRLILFLGAGASVGSKNAKNIDPPLGYELARLIAEASALEVEDKDSLGDVYAAAKSMLGSELDSLLEGYYKHCTPSQDYISLAKFPWARIYTTNIDDSFERALNRYSCQKVNIRSRNDCVEDKDQMYGKLDYVYLNGSVSRIKDGFIFSPEEYGVASAMSPLWYEELASDYMQCMFVFIGTVINEPVFFHHIERYKYRSSSKGVVSYVITPHMSSVKASSLKSYGIEHIKGTLSDFVDWLNVTFPSTPDPVDIAMNRRPEMRAMLSKKEGVEREEYANALSGVAIVSRQDLNSYEFDKLDGSIRSFYRGYKPDWKDLLDDVPAVLTQYGVALSRLNEAFARGASYFVITGPAGSGKSTMLKWLALSSSDDGRRVYFMPSKVESIVDVISRLEEANSDRYMVFVDRLDYFRKDLSCIKNKFPKVLLVGAESIRIWDRRLKDYLDSPGVYSVKGIDEVDADEILEKLRKFGPWTRLSNMKPVERRREILERSKRQLLIALMEATTGSGFDEIVGRDFSGVDEDDMVFFLAVCIATMHRCHLSMSMASRLASKLEKCESPKIIAARLVGAIEERNGCYVARHPVYARKVLEIVDNIGLVSRAIGMLLGVFTSYPHPVVKHVDSVGAALFKSIINHKFLSDSLRSDEGAVIDVYSRYEKYFESDGLYWLQYGLSLRSFNRQKEAYDRLATAYNAYPHDHTIHAFAQQKLILAASELTSDDLAKQYMDEAVQMLGKLDQFFESDDTYPIVTLAEGHVRVLRRIKGDSIARVKAVEYVNDLSRRLKNCPNSRLEKSRLKLMDYAASGVWKLD